MTDINQLYIVQCAKKEPAAAIARKESLLNPSLVLTTSGKQQQYTLLDEQQLQSAAGRAHNDREAARLKVLEYYARKQKKG